LLLPAYLGDMVRIKRDLKTFRRQDDIPCHDLGLSSPLPSALLLEKPSVLARLEIAANSLKTLARPKGFEPLTPRFVVWCSIQLSYGRAGIETGAGSTFRGAAV
jgi:hypothetical protein